MLLEAFIRSEGNSITLSHLNMLYRVKTRAFIIFLTECSLKVNISEAILRVILNVIWKTYDVCVQTNSS